MGRRPWIAQFYFVLYQSVTTCTLAIDECTVASLCSASCRAGSTCSAAAGLRCDCHFPPLSRRPLPLNILYLVVPGGFGGPSSRRPYAKGLCYLLPLRAELDTSKQGRSTLKNTTISLNYFFLFNNTYNPVTPHLQFTLYYTHRSYIIRLSALSRPRSG